MRRETVLLLTVLGLVPAGVVAEPVTVLYDDQVTGKTRHILEPLDSGQNHPGPVCGQMQGLGHRFGGIGGDLDDHIGAVSVGGLAYHLAQVLVVNIDR